MAYYTIPRYEGKTEGNRIIWETAGELVYIEPYGRDAIRFRSSKSLRIDEALNWTLEEPASPEGVIIEADDEKACMTNGKIQVTITGDGTVTYRNTRTGKVLLEEYWIDGRVHTAPLRRAREYRVTSGNQFKISLYFKAEPGEHFYGMGQDANDCFDLKGSTVELLQKNGKCTIPYTYSSRGYGFIWNNPAIGRAEFVNNHTMWHVQCAKQIDYVIIAGDTPGEINEKFTAITGRAPLLPEWAAGFWQCKLRYETQEELLQVAREYKRRGLPISVIVIDYFHWTMQGEWKFDPEKWPDPKAMVSELESMGIKLMVSVWPTIDPRSENYAYMREHNYILRGERGVDVVFMFFGPQTYVDTTHPGAREFFWSRAKKNYYDYGIRTFWLDEAEPEMRPYDYDNVRMYLGNGEEVSNIYCVGFAKAFYDGLKAQGEEVCNLVRCTWLGSQRYGVVLWSGDIASTFDSLRKQLKAGLNVAMCGIPWWTTDIGGFINGDPESEEFRELMIRWFEFGVFCPIFRLHGFRLPYPVRDILNPDGYCGSGGPNEVWSFGEEAYEIIRRYMYVREELKPYIMKQMKLASEDGTPVMRPLFYDFCGDKNVYDIGDEYMFGPDLLVAPVVELGARKRMVYLPEGCRWKDAGTGTVYDGGTRIEADAPLDTIPLFLKEDARLSLQMKPSTAETMHRG
ncbi:glycoside hydrolase family 31 protein [Enterocloster bolteae]|uniref:glycoside hydrolase family 31 protein n=1 Tax=Enterocloster bolteae TaxID=208479 RepID=UPI001D0966AC|nr:TIM-barrel domain-containing protein [Enterocloster bolteae]MCB6924860.1 glycoside hydrolase family 31 protein [Enterocloster bolteae]